jgi:hypothetical protein
MARFDGLEIPVFLRVGKHREKIYLDICDAKWRAIEIDADGWRVVDNPPIKFRRNSGMLPLPVPVQGGNIQSLRELLNVKDDNSFIMAVSFLIGALNPRGPYAIMGLGGDFGSAKTSFAQIIRDVIDPQSLPPRVFPADDRDLFIAAINGWILAYDNVSDMPVWLSDNFCRLSTGGGFATRQLYSDDDEVLFKAMRPVILNGKGEFINRPDLMDRTLMLALIRIEKPLTQFELQERFAAAHPDILGALLDAVSYGLRHLDDPKPDRLPRMADFALWVTVCEGALWKRGTFIRAYDANRAAATETVLDADPVAVAVQTFMKDRTQWKGSATALHENLSSIISEMEKRERKWPKAANTLSAKLREAAIGLREVGIDVRFDKTGIGNAKTREITITNIAVGGAAKGPDAGAMGSIANQDRHQGSTPGKPWELYVSDDGVDGVDLSASLRGQERAKQADEAKGGGAQEPEREGETPTPSTPSPQPQAFRLSEWADRWVARVDHCMFGHEIRRLDFNPGAPTPPWLVIRQTPDTKP